MSDRLLRDALQVLIGNWHGHSTVPSRGLYPHQWSWDSAFIAIGLRHWAPRRAATELLSLFGAQWGDGRIPHIVFNPAVHSEAYFPGPTFWRSKDVADAPPVATSGIMQPPVHAMAALAVTDGLGGEGLAFARRAYPCLVAQNDYLRQRRAVGPSGLAAVVHPWETGMDNSPAWDEPLHAVPADHGLFDTYTRRDLGHAGEGERPTDEDYARYIRLALDYRESGYDDDDVRARGKFLVLDPAFNALWAWSELALAELAGTIGASGEPHLAEAERITAALAEALYSPADGLFLARDARHDRSLAARTVGGLVPLVLPGLDDAVVDALVDTAIGPSFRVGQAGVRGVPSFDLTDPAHDPQRYWRGPSWLNMTWLVARGLARHGRDDLARALDEDLVGLVDGAGLWEYFHPVSGTGHGTDRFSWSAALLIDVLAQSRLTPAGTG